MIETFEAVAVAALAVLPGALYVWGFEREVGSWGIGLSDRIFRFFGVSVLAHILAAPVTYWAWAAHVRTGEITRGEGLPPILWLLALVYAAASVLLGAAVGKATRDGRSWARLFTGPDAAPRAWDHFFSNNPDGWIRLRLKSGAWIGGAYTSSDVRIDSYAAGYPNAQDLFLAETLEVDAYTGDFVLRNGRPIFQGTSLLVRWDEVEFLEFKDS